MIFHVFRQGLRTQIQHQIITSKWIMESRGKWFTDEWGRDDGSAAAVRVYEVISILPINIIDVCC